MALTKVNTGGLALDAVDNTILKLDDDYALTGAISGAGKLLQMPFTQYTSTTTVSLTANTNTIVSVLTVNITPASTSSIIRLDSHVFHEWSNSDYAAENVWFFYRDSTLLRAPTAGNRASGISISSLSYRDDATSTPETVYYSYFDAPSTTSQITYKVGVRVYANSTLYVNRTVNDTDNTQGERGISFISATEIAG
tara:strand:+ start:514 stop:1101 length:588 start_codon:yes stop_codon:yes gene_type:complete